MNIGQRLSAAIKQSGMSQSSVAAESGVTQSYINQICSGKKTPTIVTLKRICDGLGLSMQDILEEGEEDAGQALNRRVSLTGEEQTILRMWRDLDAQERELIAALMERLDRKSGRRRRKSTKAENGETDEITEKSEITEKKQNS